MIRTPGQAMQHLRGMAISGRLDVFCEAHGLRLLVVFGSVIEPDGRRPGDLDLAVRLGAGSDVVALTSALVAETACDEVDLLDLDRAGIVARANALGRCLPLFEDEPGGYTRAAMAALGLAADTAWIRRLQLERLAS